MPEPRNRIGEILLSKGIVTPEQERKAAEIQARNPDRKFGEILVHDLGVDHHTVFGELARLYAFREIDLKAETLDEGRVKFIKDILDGLPEEVRNAAVLKQALPLRTAEGQRDVLVVVTPDPTDREVASLAMRFGYRRPEIFYARRDGMEELIKRVAPPRNDLLDFIEKAGQVPEVIEAQEEAVDEAAIEAEIKQGTLGKLIEGSLIEAVRQGVSDIHIVPQEGNRTEFHFRLDGDLRVWYTHEGTKPEAVAAVVKDRSKNVDRFERESAQDGFIQREIDGHRIRFRVSIMPMVGSEFERKFESVVIRVLDDRNVVTDLRKLGLQPRAMEDFENAIKRPQGIVILTGPTGSGKTTTLNAALHYVIDPTVNVLTIEDPVEYIIRGARQLKISDRMTFDQALRSILRHDPDIVLVEEIWDLKTAETAIKLANPGHLTFASLHTNDAPSAVSRLYKMGVESFLIASAVNIIVAQRLIRRLCNACKRPAKDIDKEVYLHAGMTEAELTDTVIHEPVGCPKCNGGYRGRAAIHEALLFTKEIRRLILSAGEQVNEEAIREQATRNGMLTLRASGLARIKEGVSTLEEVLAATLADE